MKLAFCAACGMLDDLQHHHLVTRGEQGGDDETNIITLCYPCHAKLHERKLNGVYSASQRTSAGLQAAKAKGVKLGNQQIADANAAAAKARAEALRPLLTELSSQSANAIAKALNARSVATPTGRPWSAKTVIRVQRRLEAAP